MKALSSSLLLVLAICVSAMIPSSAADDKLLKNVRGSVTIQQSTTAAPQVAVALDAVVAIANTDYAITGVNSQAWITLPDSSRVEVGQNTKVQMAAFDSQPGITTAHFIIVGPGKTRFVVAHPAGAKANYTFQTSTGQIAVRGTEGDISSSDTQLQVNCYELSDPNLPVQVHLNNGKDYTLSAGQSLVVGVAAGVVATAAVSQLSDSLVHPFDEFGPAANVAKLAAAISPGAAVAAGAAAAAGAVVASTSHGTTPSAPFVPTPTPSPSTQPTATPGTLTVMPASLTFTAPGQTQTLTARQPHFRGTYAFSVSGDEVGVSQSANIFTVTSQHAGTTSIIIQGAGGTSPVNVPVDVESGVVVLSVASLAFGNTTTPAQLDVHEQGYTGNFKISGGSSIVSFNTLSSTRAFTANGVSNGSTTFTVTDANGNFAKLPARVVLGPIVLNPTAWAFNPGASQTKQLVATEAAFGSTSGDTFTASSDNAAVSVSPASSTTGSFTMTAKASTGTGHATITVTDGQPWGHTTTEIVTVTTPSPAPSTTCVPIIINGKHAHTAATPCPTPTPSTLLPPRKVGPPQPHPLGPPPPPGATPKPERTPRPMLTPPSGPHPGGPGIPGMQTPPPLPGPPGR